MVRHHSLKVLLVDADPASAEFCKLALSQVTSTRFTVTHVEGPAEAVKRLSAAVYDVVLLAIHHSDIGLKAFTIIRQTNNRLPVVVMTDVRDRETALHLLREGAQDHFVKSATAPHALEDAILYAIERQTNSQLRQELAVKEAEKRLRPVSKEVIVTEKMSFADFVLEHVEAAIVVLTPEERFRSINRQCTDLCGCSIFELQNCTFVNAFASAKEAEDVQKAMLRLKQGEKLVRFENCLVAKHGGKRRIEWFFRSLKNVDGTIHALVGTGIDIEKHFEAAQRLARLEAELTSSQPTAEVHREGGTSRRAHPRLKYGRRQVIAPIVNGVFPSPESFCEVFCPDISQGGISYLISKRPDYRELVVGLGKGTERRYMKAEVRHIQIVEHEGAFVYRVGCQFMGRIDARTVMADALHPSP